MASQTPRDYDEPTSTAKGSSASHTTTSSTSAPSAIHSVDVGEDGFTFDPDTLAVSPGGKVEFHFYPGNHSVVQAAFSRPCHPLSESNFFSGFIPATDGESPEVFTLTVNDTKPIWYYCGQVGHYQDGMVGVINPPGNGPDTLDAFKSAASEASDITVPTTVSGGIFGKPSNESTTGTAIASSSSGSTSASMSAGTGSTTSPSPSPTAESSTLRAWRSLSLALFLSLLVGVRMM
ncbi:cupredoxin domain-containing protein [Aspergillus alliaceus]|uniref:cupredoxin domain-containing protein n=1 Tax=Petromyces alliaceus TaxID=209559 RepID=UPI0012A73DFA|nr:Cupredoxin [Aspergillus alliaceus]KAB8239033.1 Cupredoxin [Aspergillus alliaceus]